MPDLTLEDVAKQAGVSRSTVSRVVNNNPNVSDDVRRRVLDVIKQTGYHPNAAARALASQRSWTLGLVLPQSVSQFFTDPYYPHLIKGIAQGCNQHNFILALFLVATKDDERKVFTQVTRKGLLDGVLVQSGHQGDHQIIGSLIEAGVPQVVLGRPLRFDNVSNIDVDNISAVYNAVTHLVRTGYRRIATITGPHQSAVGLDRLQGYKRALVERGYAVEQELIVDGDFTEAGGYYAMQKLLPAKPDAVFAASDLTALGAMRAIRDAGLEVPGDIAMVGFDDIPLAVTLDPPLTTVRQPTQQFGLRAVELLIDLIENGLQPPRHIMMDTQLVIRSSCGASRKHLAPIR